MTRRPQLALLLLLPLVLAAVPRPAAAASPGAAAAVELLAAAERAHAAAVAAVQDAPGWMGSRHSGHAAVAAGLDEVRGALAAVRRALAERDAALPRALRRGSVAAAGLRVAWGRSGLAAPAAARRLHELAAALDLLRARCGAEAARAGRGAPLTPGEREQLAAVQRARRDLAVALAPLHQRAAARGDRGLARELQRWIAQSERIAAAPPAVEVLLEAVWLADDLRGEWTAAAPHVPPPDRGEWLAAHEAVEEVLGESEVGYVVVADLGDGSAPLRVEAAAQEPGGEAVEVQVLGPAPGGLPPEDLEEGWVGEEEGAEEVADAAAAEAPAEEELVETGPPDETPEAEEEAESSSTIEVVSESGEVLTVELGEAGGPDPSAPSPSPPADPAPAPPPD